MQTTDSDSARIRLSLLVNNTVVFLAFIRVPEPTERARNEPPQTQLTGKQHKRAEKKKPVKTEARFHVLTFGAYYQFMLFGAGEQMRRFNVDKTRKSQNKSCRVL